MTVSVAGAYTTHFKRWPEKDHTTLAAEAVAGVMEDALVAAGDIQSIWFSCCALHAFGQPNIGGQATLSPLMENGVLPSGIPITNVEGGCASGGLALRAAWLEVLSGQVDVALVLGVEKLFMPDTPGKMVALFEGGMDQLHPSLWKQQAQDAAASLGSTFAPIAQRSVILDVAALAARQHMKQHAVTSEMLAAVASKSHFNGARNPKAQYQKEFSTQDILKETPLLEPFTRSMCAPISDGAAAVLLVSQRKLRSMDPRTQQRAATLNACCAASGGLHTDPIHNATTRAATAAYRAAEMKPSDIHVAEVHDATSFSELLAYERLGFCEAGQGGVMALSGKTALDGALPVNTSGGLVSKGHPLGATGLAMVNELVTQLRGEAGARQAKRPVSRGLFHNAGGMLGLDEAAAVVGILSR